MELLITIGLALMWAVAVCAPNCEALATRGLGRQGIESYHPRFRPVGRAVRPLFPGYLFVRQTDVWRSVLGTRGVVRLIMDAGYPAMLGEDVVQGVRDREGREGLVELPDAFVTGTKVRIARGGLVDQVGICDGSDERRVYVLLQFLGRQVRTRFERADLVIA